MLQNYLSTSGTIQSVPGNDSKAPEAYWNSYTYRTVSSGEISGLIDGDIYTSALSLSPGEYTCLEISFDEPIYISQLRCYFAEENSSTEVALSYPHTTENPSSYIVDLSNHNNVIREDIKGPIRYYDRVDSSTGYVEGEQVSVVAGEYAQLISAVYFTSVSGELTDTHTGLEDKTIYQIIRPDGEGSVFSQLTLQAGSSPVDIESVSIAPVSINTNNFNFNNNTQDDDRRDELRWWRSDNGASGHFEGEQIFLDVGATITGSWNSFTSWSGNTSRDEHLELAGYTVRQLIPAGEITSSGDGLRVTLKGGTQDVKLNYMSYMPANSQEVDLEVGINATAYRENIKGDIDRWKNDGEEGGGWESVLSRHRGHFESYEIDIDNSPAVKFTANIIGIPATSHGLQTGDYIRIYGTTYYDGYYYILPISTPDLIYVWGIWDPETFTDSAVIRKVISIGPEYSDLGEKQNSRGVLPYNQINFLTGESASILEYSDHGLAHASVKIGPEEHSSSVVTSIYDVIVSDGWVSNTPGLDNTPDFQQSMPNMNIKAEDRRWPDRYFYDDSKAKPSIGHYDGGYGEVQGELWSGELSCISESQDPEYEGDLTGWKRMSLLFDHDMAQPWYTLLSLADCPWITMSYRGPIPVKFIVDLGSPRLMTKYRYWIQEWLCPDNTTVGYPRSWKLEASNHGDDNLDWDVIHEQDSYLLSDFTVSYFPPDNRVGGSCSESEWMEYPILEPYRYYRFNIYDSWTCEKNPGHFECCHIDEIDFVEHRCSAGIFPTVIDTSLYIDKVEKIIPNEHLRLGAKIFYALSFDGGDSYEIYRSDIEQWRTIARYESGEWQYFDGLVWRTTDADKPEENTLRFILWYAFSVFDNRMDADDLQNIPPDVYDQKMPNGGYIDFAVGLVSTGRMEAILKSITLRGTIFNPNGSAPPTEITFESGNHGCTVSAGGQVMSDWINADVIDGRDGLFVMDLDTTASSVPYYDYTSGYKYFHHMYLVSYDVQTVNLNGYTLSSGVVLLDSVETRQSNTITLPASGHNLVDGSYIRVSGTFPEYDGYHYVDSHTADSVDIVSKHWFDNNPVPSGSYIQRRYSVGLGTMQPHMQVGSILQFREPGEYIDYQTVEGTDYPTYYVDSNVFIPGKEATNLFDNASEAEFHSGQPIKYGPVVIGLHLSSPKNFDRYRFKSADNNYYWEKEYPSYVYFEGSNLSSPALTNDSHWESICSGIVSLPIGPARFSDWCVGSSTIPYQHYRFKINSNRGDTHDAIRFAQIDVASASGSLAGYTLIEEASGFSSSYLFDSSPKSEYTAVGISSLPSIHIDLRGKKKPISRIRFKASTNNLWAGDSVMQSFTIDATESFPYIIFTLPDGASIYSITVKVLTPFIGGYYGVYGQANYSPAYGNNTGAGTSICRSLSGPLSEGRYIVQMGKYTFNSQNWTQWKLARRDNDDQFDIINLERQGFTQLNSTTWFELSTPHKVEDGEWYPAIATSDYRAWYYFSEPGWTAYYKDGDLTGDDLTGWDVDSSTQLFLAVRYSTLYQIGIDSDHDKFIGNASFVSTKASTGWTGSYTASGDTDIKIWNLADSLDTSGTILVEVVTSSLGEAVYTPRANFPKSFLLSGSNETAPSVDDEEDWSAVASFDYGSSAPTEGAWCDWLSVPSGLDYDPYRHYRIRFLSNMNNGGVVHEEYTIDIAGSSPFTIFTLPAGSVLYSIDLSVNTIAEGGYSDHYRDVPPHTGVYWNDTYPNVTRISWYGGYVLANNRYITQVGAYYDGLGGISYHYAKYLGNDRFDMGEIGSVIIGTDHNGSFVWTSISPKKIPLVGAFYLSCYGDVKIGKELVDKHWYKDGNQYSGTNVYFDPVRGERGNLDVRYGNYYSVGDSDDNYRFISNFQPYGLVEQDTWGGAYGPFTEDKIIRVYNNAVGNDTQGQLKVSISRSAVGGGNLIIRAAECEFETSGNTYADLSYVTYSGSFPTKLMELPAWHTLVGGQVEVFNPFLGGYAEQVGYVASGTYNNSFWTVVDRHWQLQNSRAISQVGVYADKATDIKLKQFKVRTGTEWFDISEIQTLTHSGTGFEWFELTEPHIIPDEGVYHLGWWQEDSAVRMADSTGTGDISYEYGDLTGTNIRLAYNNSMRPCLAVRYSSCFTVGINSSDDIITTFSPVLGSREYNSVVEIGPYNVPRDIYLYKDCTMTSGDTQGLMKVSLNYQDSWLLEYGAREFSVFDNTHLSYTRPVYHLLDGSSSTDWFSYHEKSSPDPVYCGVRFDTPRRIVGFRYRKSSDPTGSLPMGVKFGYKDSYPENLSVMDDTIYEDENYLFGDEPSSWGPWVYLDYYEEEHRYFIFHFWRPLSADQYDHNHNLCIGDLELLVEYESGTKVVVSELFEVVKNIENGGMFDSEVTLGYHAGDSREIISVYNTFSHNERNELSPGTYFYRGENTPHELNYQPQRVSKIYQGLEEEVGVTHPTFAGMGLLAWHRLDEEEGDYSDSSGNEVTAYRVGQVTSSWGRRSRAATVEDEGVDANILCTLPSDLYTYTVAFWYSPGHNIHEAYNKKIDIMGGWISYGAIPGVWHISISKHMLYSDDPYPSVQDNDLSGDEFGHMVFGNYGACVQTSRFLWSAGSWYHVVFSFNTSPSAGNPYRCWINGVRDQAAEWFGYDNGWSVYPPSSVIMADPDDIHYTTHDQHNCMYFGLPLEDGAGLSFEHSLQDIMHFNKVLSDEEVYKIYRLRSPLSDEWDGIYFPDTETVDSPGKIIIDLGEARCVTKYGLMVPSGTTDNVWWRLQGSGTQGKTTLHETYQDFISIPDYYNIVNPDDYRYYVVDILGSDDKVDYLLFNGLRLVGTDRVPTVSGTYETITSGVRSKPSIIELWAGNYMPPGSLIDFSFLVGSGSQWLASVSGTWVSGSMSVSGIDDLRVCDWDMLGSGTFYTRHRFTSDPMFHYPAVTSIQSKQTDWSTTVSSTSVGISGSLGVGETISGGWFRYSQDQAEFHKVALALSDSNGNPSYGSYGYGYLIDGDYTCSGSYLIQSLEGRKDDLVSLAVASLGDVDAGSVVLLENAGPYDGRWIVASGISTDLLLYVPYEPYEVSSGATYRVVVDEVVPAGSELVTTSGSATVISVSGGLVGLDRDLESQPINTIHTSLVTSSGVKPTREFRNNEKAGSSTHVFNLDLTSNTTPAPFRVFESTEDSNLYKLFDSRINNTKTVNRVVVDLGQPVWVNSYRWFYGNLNGSEVSPDYWEVYVANELPYWDQVASEVETSVSDWEWSQHYSLPTTSGYRYYLFKFYEDVDLREIELCNINIYPSTEDTICLVSASGSWSYSGLGRLSRVEVLSEEPGSSQLYHAVSFDENNSFSVYEGSTWQTIVRLNGSDWQYYDSGWSNASDNNVHQAFREAVESGWKLTTADLQEIKEAEWHQTGAIEVTSGVLSFITMLENNGLDSPVHKGYNLLYAQGSVGLIPDEFSYSQPQPTVTGNYTIFTLLPENSTEQYYDRKKVQDIRVYVTNSDSSEDTEISELAVVDTQTPNDIYYLNPEPCLTSDDPIYLKNLYHERGFAGLSDNNEFCSYSGVVYTPQGNNLSWVEVSSKTTGDISTAGTAGSEAKCVVISGSPYFFNPGSGTLYGATSLVTSGMPTFSGSDCASVFKDVRGDVWLVKHGEAGGLWQLRDNTWHSRFAFKDSPLPRHYADVCYDSRQHSMLIFGGYLDDGAGNKYTYDDFWELDLHTGVWTEKPKGPSGRYGSALALNEATNCIYLYGGTSSGIYFSDTWIYDKRWSCWLDMTDVWGVPETTGTSHSKFLYHPEDRNMFLIGGGVPLQTLDLVDPYDSSFEHVSPFRSDYFVENITSTLTKTGGVLLNEGGMIRFQVSDIPDSKKIYYAELKVYFEPELGPPHGIEIIDVDTGDPVDPITDAIDLTSWKQYNNYISSFIWSDSPLENFTLELYNNNTVGEGPLRIYEVQLEPITYSGVWNVEDTFNLIESSYTTTLTEVSGMESYTFKKLSTPHLERLIYDVESAMPILPGYAIALDSSFYDFGGKSSEVRAYLDTTSGVQVMFMTQVSGSDTWNQYEPVWNGNYFSYLFYEPQNITQLQVYIGNYGATYGLDLSSGVTFSGVYSATYEDIRWLRSVQLINCGDEIDFGTTGSGVGELELPTYYTDYNKIQIYNNKRNQRYANARILPRFSGNYHLDRNIRISEDKVNWTDLEDGIRFPEDYQWEMGDFTNTRVSEDTILLDATATSGNWVSPIIEVLDPSSNAAYVYVKNINYDQSYVTEDYVSINNVMKVRSSHVKPMQLFLATAVNTDNQWGLQAPWKAVWFDSSGNLMRTKLDSGPPEVYNEINQSGQSVVDEPYPPRRYWASSVPYLWQFYGALDSRGGAGVSLGLHWVGSSWITGMEVVEDDDYRFYRGFYPGAVTESTYNSSIWGDTKSILHLYNSNWLYLPVFNKTLRMVDRLEGGVTRKCWQMVDVVYRPSPFYELYQEQYFSDKTFHARNIYSFKGNANTPESNTEIDYIYSFEKGTLSDLENNGIRCSACVDSIVHPDQGDYYWLAFSATYESNYYKILLVNGTEVEKEFDTVEKKFNFIVEAGGGAPTRGFWGVTETAVYWYSYNGTTLTEEFGVTSDSSSLFKSIYHASVDFMNNLWFVDLITERVIRVNFKSKSVDYSRVVSGASSVACDPYDGSAYVYVIRSPEFPNHDAIQLVHVDYDYLEPETICKVPGVALMDSFNVNLLARSTYPPGYYDVLPGDVIWGSGSGSAEWVNYSAASPTLPKGIYKQFKLTLRREDLEAASPEVEYLRIPVPAILNKIPWKGYKEVYVDTIPRAENYDLPAGTHTLDLLVWWGRA